MGRHPYNIGYINSLTHQKKNHLSKKNQKKNQF